MKVWMHCVVRLVFFLALVPCFLAAGNASASTHYIANGGNDSATGLSTSAPWAHLPGMRTWTGSYTPVAGDRFILRGCDVWPNASFPINWNWAGTALSPIYIGVDQTWYNTSTCPSGWNRPVFDAGGTPIPSNNEFVYLFADWSTWDWIEARGLNWISNSGVSCLDNTRKNSGIVVDHWYVHAWSHGGTATEDEFLCFVGQWPPPAVGSLVQHTVFDGSDSTNGGDTGNFSYHWNSGKWNVIHEAQNVYHVDYASNASSTEIAYNTMYHIGWKAKIGTEHENEISIGGCSTDGDCTFYIHDNLEYDNPAGEGMYSGATAGEIDYIWNNTIMSTWNGTFVMLAQGNTVGSRAAYVWNNTIVPPNTLHPMAGRGNVACFTYGPTITSPVGTYFRRNNHCISDVGIGTIPAGFASTVIDDHNVLIGSAAAAAQGYDQVGSFFYSPQSSNCNGIPTNCPIGVGANGTEDQYRPPGFPTTDTTYACYQGTANGVVQVICPTRTANSRPATGAWDVGAYQFTLTSGTVPGAPTGLAATVR